MRKPPRQDRRENVRINLDPPPAGLRGGAGFCRIPMAGAPARRHAPACGVLTGGPRGHWTGCSGGRGTAAASTRPRPGMAGIR